MLAHQIPVILGGGFDPSVIFAEMPGAWLEPRIGRMWQENTGTTPTNTAGQSIGKINDLSGYGYNATQATLANRPTIQYANGLPIVSCDSNDFMTVGLAAINVRRNLLTYSENFDNAAWAKGPTISIVANQALSPNGYVTADKMQVNTSGQAYVVNGPYSVAGGQAVTMSCSFSAAGIGFAYIQVNEGGGSVIASAARINLATGSTNLAALAGGGLASATVSSVRQENGHWRVILSWITNAATTSVWSYLGSCDSLSSSNSTASGSSGVYLFGAQFELGSVATDYQKITDWTSEQFSSSGSVYFALNTGMSALHGQSIGTSYSAPIQSMDLYGAVIVPSRLSDQREAQLQIYFEKLAGLR